MRNKATIVESETIDRIAAITGQHRMVVRDVLHALTEFTLYNISRGIPVRIGNLGEISVIEYMAGGGYNFAKKQLNEKKVHRKIKFRASAAVKRAVSGKE